jgi:hypothetical protein
MTAQYFAKLNSDNVVITVHVVTAEYMSQNPELYSGVWVETFVDLPNKTYAGDGYTYDPITQDFTMPVYVDPLV